jgi:hypothetical protein
VGYVSEFFLKDWGQNDWVVGKNKDNCKNKREIILYGLC